MADLDNTREAANRFYITHLGHKWSFEEFNAAQFLSMIVFESVMEYFRTYPDETERKIDGEWVADLSQHIAFRTEQIWCVLAENLLPDAEAKEIIRKTVQRKISSEKKSESRAVYDLIRLYCETHNGPKT